MQKNTGKKKCLLDVLLGKETFLSLECLAESITEAHGQSYDSDTPHNGNNPLKSCLTLSCTAHRGEHEQTFDMLQSIKILRLLVFTSLPPTDRR